MVKSRDKLSSEVRRQEPFVQWGCCKGRQPSISRKRPNCVVLHHVPARRHRPTIAGTCFQIKAIRLQPERTLYWASGWKSPIYCDNRIALSYPGSAPTSDKSWSKPSKHDSAKPDVIAGVATAAIPARSARSGSIGVTIRFTSAPRPKKTTVRQNLIEGEVKPGQTVVVIEDLVSTGKSSLKAVEALREAGCTVKRIVGRVLLRLKEKPRRISGPLTARFTRSTTTKCSWKKPFETKRYPPNTLKFSANGRRSLNIGTLNELLVSVSSSGFRVEVKSAALLMLLRSLLPLL